MKAENSLPILIASDHAGFKLKQFIIDNLIKSGYQIEDLGCDYAEKSVDYPDYAQKLCHKIKEDGLQKGILICGSGIGISIAANRFKHVRAALCEDIERAKLSRQHNDANVICLGSRFVGLEDSIKIITTFLATKFEGERHATRVSKLSK